MSTAYRTVCIAVVVAAAAVATACGADTDTTSARSTSAVDVRTVRAQARQIATTFEAGGIVRARMTAQLASRIVADVVAITAQPGDRVVRGQVLVELDRRELDARRAQAHASLSAATSSRVAAEAERESASARLALARATHARVEGLRARNSATFDELDRAVSDLRVAEAGVRSAEARHAEAQSATAAGEAAVRAADVAVSFATIVAPFDGIVTARLMEPGNLVAPGVPLVMVETADRYRLELQIDEARARSLRLGDSVALRLDSNGEDEDAAGPIVEIARAIDPAAHAFLVKVQLPAGMPARSGMFARATFTVCARTALVVPASAVIRRGQLLLVFVVDDDGRARMRAVHAGPEIDGSIEVLAGVQSGEIVIQEPSASLIDGASVRVIGDRS
jgi:multidrug efflux pump subunit AcrA (membrane-fusion protein)